MPPILMTSGTMMPRQLGPMMRPPRSAASSTISATSRRGMRSVTMTTSLTPFSIASKTASLVKAGGTRRGDEPHGLDGFGRRREARVLGEGGGGGDGGAGGGAPGGGDGGGGGVKNGAPAPAAPLAPGGAAAAPGGAPAVVEALAR